MLLQAYEKAIGYSVAGRDTGRILVLKVADQIFQNVISRSRFRLCFTPPPPLPRPDSNLFRCPRTAEDLWPQGLGDDDLPRQLH